MTNFVRVKIDTIPWEESRLSSLYLIQFNLVNLVNTVSIDLATAIGYEPNLSRLTTSRFLAHTVWTSEIAIHLALLSNKDQRTQCG